MANTANSITYILQRTLLIVSPIISLISLAIYSHFSIKTLEIYDYIDDEADFNMFIRVIVVGIIAIISLIVLISSGCHNGICSCLVSSKLGTQLLYSEQKIPD